MENTVKSVRETIKDEISQAGPTVASIVAKELAAVEIDRRKNIIISGMAQLDKLEKEFRKHKPDNISYTIAEGSKPVESATWSKAGLEAFEKDKAKIEKLSKAIDSALENNTADGYAKVVEASK